MSIDTPEEHRWEILPQQTVWLAETRELYRSVYGDQYTLTQIMDPEESQETLKSEHSWWWVAREGDAVVASVLFSIEPKHRLGKAYGGVVAPSARGSSLMKTMVALGLKELLDKQNKVDAVYAVVRTFVSLQFHRDLADIGFLDLGVFPNVRKVREYETHGLKLCLSERFLESRRKGPRLAEEIMSLYDIVRQPLGLEAAEEFPGIAPVREFEVIELSSDYDFGTPQDVVDYYHKVHQDLQCAFFPLQKPTIVLKNKELGCEVFVSYQPRDGHSSILGVRLGEADFSELLFSVGSFLESLGVVYLELLLSAYEPEIQSKAISAGFLPCAYFLGGKMNDNLQREDIVVTSKTFVPLHFRRLRVSETFKPFLLEYFKLYSSRLWEELIYA